MTCGSCGVAIETGHTVCPCCHEPTNVSASELESRFGAGYDPPYAIVRFSVYATKWLFGVGALLAVAYALFSFTEPAQAPFLLRAGAFAFVAALCLGVQAYDKGRRTHIPAFQDEPGCGELIEKDDVQFGVRAPTRQLVRGTPFQVWFDVQNCVNRARRVRFVLRAFGQPAGWSFPGTVEAVLAPGEMGRIATWWCVSPSGDPELTVDVEPIAKGRWGRRVRHGKATKYTPPVGGIEMLVSLSHGGRIAGGGFVMRFRVGDQIASTVGEPKPPEWQSQWKPADGELNRVASLL
jgi:hypothetical protein